MKKYLSKEKEIVAEATELNKLLSGYTDEQIFNELQKRGYFGEITKRISIHNDDDQPF